MPEGQLGQSAAAAAGSGRSSAAAAAASSNRRGNNCRTAYLTNKEVTAERFKRINELEALLAEVSSSKGRIFATSSSAQRGIAALQVEDTVKLKTKWRKELVRLKKEAEASTTS